METFEIPVRPPYFTVPGWRFEPIKDGNRVYIGTYQFHILVSECEQKIAGVNLQTDDVNPVIVDMLQKRVEDAERTMLKKLQQKYAQ